MEKDLTHKEAIEKIKKLAEDINICMLCTNLDHHPFSVRPMALKKVDEEGNLWFISSAASHMYNEIKLNDSVQLLFSKPSSSQFLSLYGKASIYRDKQKIEDLWSPIAKAWFEEGKEDANVTVLKVAPSEAYYWDTPNGKMVTLLKMAAAAVTGKKMDTGEKGKLNI